LVLDLEAVAGLLYLYTVHRHHDPSDGCGKFVGFFREEAVPGGMFCPNYTIPSFTSWLASGCNHSSGRGVHYSSSSGFCPVTHSVA